MTRADTYGGRWSGAAPAPGCGAGFAAIFLLEAAAFFALPSAGDVVTFAALAFVVVLCFGGGLGTMPAFAADYFGPKHVGAIFGLILTASGFGSVLGPLLLAFSLEATGGYGPALRLLGALALGAPPSRCSSARPRPDRPRARDHLRTDPGSAGATSRRAERPGAGPRSGGDGAERHLRGWPVQHRDGRRLPRTRSSCATDRLSGQSRYC